MEQFYHLSKPINIISLYSFFAPVYDENFYFNGERHDFWEFVLVLDGKVGIAEDDKIYELSKGDIIFHKPMEFHRIWSEKGTSPSLIIASFTANGFGMENLAEGVFNIDDTTTQLIKEAAGIAIEKIIEKPNWKKDYILHQLVSNKLENAFLYVLRNAKASLKENNTTEAKNYKAIINVMNDNIDKALSVDDFARLTSLSTANLKKCFKKYSGMGVISYFNRLKIMKAESLIAEGYSMSEISEMLGFSSQNYFSTAFKRENGLSPFEYKKNLHNE